MSERQGKHWVPRSQYDALAAELAEYKEGIREVMDDHATTLERLDEAGRLLAVCADRIRSMPPENSDGERANYRALAWIDAFLRPADSAPAVTPSPPCAHDEAKVKAMTDGLNAVLCSCGTMVHFIAAQGSAHAECAQCGGDGQLWMPLGSEIARKIQCENCGGTGRVTVSAPACQHEQADAIGEEGNFKIICTGCGITLREPVSADVVHPTGPPDDFSNGPWAENIDASRNCPAHGPHRFAACPHCEQP